MAKKDTSSTSQYQTIKPDTGKRGTQPKTSAGPKPKPNTPENKKAA